MPFALGNTIRLLPHTGEGLQKRIEQHSIPIPESGCWIWIGANNPDGYGEITVKGKVQSTHRMSYQAFIGPIPKGMQILHKCDIPACVNPRHLFLGTQNDNVKDCIKKGRRGTNGYELKTHCKNGHEFNSENTYIDKLSNRKPRRTCKQCRRERLRIYKIKTRCRNGR